jgi:cytochrome c biogenesis protein CcmG/thiol:disulfide interchange protein DsbE
MMAAGGVSLSPVVCAENPNPPSPPNCISCEAFGVQKFDVRKGASPFSLKSLDGTQVSLNDFKGKPVLLVFWATWCPSCMEELPAFEKFSLGKRDQLAILMLAIDGEKEKRVERAIKKNKVTLPVLLDVKERVARTYGVNFIPAAFLIDREGLMVGKVVGERDWTCPEAWSAVKEIFSLR